jgi:glutaconate CoA-transferase, subunit A
MARGMGFATPRQTPKAADRVDNPGVQSDFATIDALAAAVPSGCRLALPADYAGVAMALTAALLRRAPRELRLLCVPTAGLQADLLIGAGLVRCIETSAVSLGEAGGAPCFNRAVALGEIELLDSTCPAVHAGLLAAQKGVPFATLRGLIGTDVLRHRSDWRTMQNPFSEAPDPIVALPAIHPDVAIFHAPMADRYGNVWIGRRRELASMAYASRSTCVTVERVIDGNLMDDERTAAGVLPALYVAAVALAPGGAWPCGLWGEYTADMAEMRRYARLARTVEGFRSYLANGMFAQTVESA